MSSQPEEKLGQLPEVPTHRTRSPVFSPEARLNTASKPDMPLSPVTQLKGCGKPPVPPKGPLPGHKDESDSTSKLVKKQGSLDAKPGWFRRKLASVLYPDAKQVNLEDTSAKMEAYYDKSRQCWIFPNADVNTQAPEAGPPPAPPKMMPPSALTQPPKMTEVDDPLDAMMAPPRRSSSTPSMAASPLTAMMAPPPMRSMPNSGSRSSNNDAMTVCAPKPSQSVPTFATFTAKPVGT